MSNLDTQTKTYNIVINIPKNRKDLDIIKLTDYFNRSTYLFALILHDKDTDKEGVLKTPHYHLVLKCQSKHRLSTMLYRLADILGFYNNDELTCIHIDTCDSLPLSIQYLTHKNNIDKWRYEFDDIIHNFNKDDFIALYNEKPQVEITTSYLVDLVKKYTDFEILTIIGASRFHFYKGTIKDIRDALQRTPNLVDQFLNSVDSGNKI